jgi:hypothetical protein
MERHVYKLVTSAMIALMLVGAANISKAGNPGDTTGNCTTALRVDCPCAGGPTREFVKTITRDFKTSANGTTAIYNRHGDINIRTWSENRVKIDINIVVNAYNQKEAEKAMGQINANFTNTNGYIKAETMIGNLNNWGGSYYDWVDKSEKKCQDYRISYEVWIPADNQLDLQNKYGASFVSNINGKLSADIWYGDLRVENVRSDVNIKIEGGNATLGSVKNLYGQVASGGIVIENAADIQMDIRNSECTFRRAGNIRLTSKYDNLAFGNIENLRLQTKYSEVNVLSARTAFITAQYTDAKISNIGLQLDADFQNGDLVVEKLNAGFDLVNLIGNAANVVISRAPGISYKYLINGNNTQMVLANTGTGNKAYSKNASNGNSGFVKEGMIGNDGNTRSTLKARMTYGSITLK